MSGGHDDPFDDEVFRPAPPPNERTWMHPSEMHATPQPRRWSPWRTVGLVAVGLVVMVSTVALVGRGMELSSHSDLDASAHLTASTELGTTSTVLVTSIGVRTSLDLTGYDATGGVRVSACAPGGAAKKAGIRPGDLLVRIGDDAVRNLTRLDSLMAEFEPGQHVVIVVLRNGATIRLTVVLDQAS
jgi:hypothetical protein